MTLFQENALQIFLTLYYGQLLGTFVFDYIVRSSIEILYANYEWNMLTFVILGIVFCVAVGWALMATWSKNRRQLVITTIVLISIFVIRLIVGIPSKLNFYLVYFSESSNFAAFVKI
jgi:hypothetical protein